MFLFLGICAVSGNSSGTASPFAYFTVPNGLEEIDANDGAAMPFSGFRIGAGIRYQQVMAAGQFSQIPTGGLFLSRIVFRPNCGNKREWTVANLQVNLSTTTKTPDGLSPRFSENIGADEMVAYTALIRVFAGPADPCPGVGAFSSEIDPEVPFLYDPAKGNLLLDFRISDASISGGGPFDPPARMDAQTVSGDSISRVAGDLDAAEAYLIDTTGLVLLFEFDPLPSLSLSNAPSELVLRWQRFPNAFRVETTDILTTGVVWKEQAGEPEIIGDFKVLHIPKASLSRRKYFRLHPNLSPVITPNASSR